MVSSKLLWLGTERGLESAGRDLRLQLLAGREDLSYTFGPLQCNKGFSECPSLPSVLLGIEMPSWVGVRSEQTEALLLEVLDLKLLWMSHVPIPSSPSLFHLRLHPLGVMLPGSISRDRLHWAEWARSALWFPPMPVLSPPLAARCSLSSWGKKNKSAGEGWEIKETGIHFILPFLWERKNKQLMKPNSEFHEHKR